MSRALAAGAALLLAAAPLVSCGYTTGLTLAEGYRTVGVEIFGNRSPERDLERELHAAMVRSVARFVEGPLVPPEEADIVLRGMIRDYRRRSGVRNRQNELLETGVRIEVTAELWDRRAETKLHGPVSAGIDVGYTLDESRNEAGARARALHNLADRVVLDLVAGAAPAEASED